jgi:Protein of unknown function (DUF1569)
VKERITRLLPGSERQWGKMSPAQAVAHCSVAMEWAVRDSCPPRMFLGRMLGPMAKSKVLGDERSMGKNARTAKSLVVADERDLGVEQKRLCALIDRFASAGPQGCTTHPHTFFERLTPAEWATLMYKHLDHHHLETQYMGTRYRTTLATCTTSGHTRYVDSVDGVRDSAVVSGQEEIDRQTW